MGKSVWLVVWWFVPFLLLVQFAEEPSAAVSVAVLC